MDQFKFTALHNYMLNTKITVKELEYDYIRVYFLKIDSTEKQELKYRYFKLYSLAWKLFTDRSKKTLPDFLYEYQLSTYTNYLDYLLQSDKTIVTFDYLQDALQHVSSITLKPSYGENLKQLALITKNKPLDINLIFKLKSFDYTKLVIQTLNSNINNRYQAYSTVHSKILQNSTLLQLELIRQDLPRTTQKYFYIENQFNIILHNFNFDTNTEVAQTTILNAKNTIKATKTLAKRLENARLSKIQNNVT